MPHLEDLEKAVKNLPEPELKKFRRWFAEYDADAWDAQLEADAASGKLNALADEALADYENGNAREF